MTRTTFILAAHPASADSGTLAVTGEIDLTNTAEFLAAITDRADPRPVVVDLSELRFIDSAGFATLDELLARQAIVIVIAPGSRLRRAAALMGLPHHDSLPDR
jgi:anti-sigma B factor antagonist